jgi:ADP-ribose pyrophosphatase
VNDPRGERLGSRRVYQGRVLNVDLDHVRSPNGTELHLEMIRHPGAAAVVALLSDPKADDPVVLLIRQYRYAARDMLWEIPAGVLDPGEDPLACARRELLEETGAVPQHIEPLTTIYTTPGFTDERIHLFLATGIRAGSAAPKPDELIEVDPQPMSRVLEMIRAGQIADAKSIVALLYLAGFRLNM